jgi:hypothetical protein|tara:strand:- start:10462 stop:10806 length:345 start_codon:yes stop_codon:yes gene_type:complete
MKPVMDIFTRQNFESMKLAGEILGIPVTKIKESADESRPVMKGKRKFQFAYSTITETRTFEVKKFTFGKYKNQLIEKCEDLPYLEWYVKLPQLNAQFKHALKKRINNIKNSKNI